MYCTNCGEIVTDKMNFCPKCGEIIVPSLQPVKPLRIEKFRATSLILGTMYADFKVSFGNSPDVIVRIDGDEEMTAALSFLDADGTLVVMGRLPGITGVLVNPIIEVWDDGTIMVDGKKLDERKKLKIEVDLPLNFELEIQRHTLGNMAFVNAANDMKVRNYGTMSIEAKTFRNLNLSAAGGGNFTADSVDNCLTAGLSGSSDVKILGGTTQTLTVSADGSSNFRFPGHAMTGSFIAIGTSDIKVGSCGNVINNIGVGASKIKIG